MPVPPFYEFFRPFLALLADEGQLSRSEVYAKLATQFSLTDEALATRLAEGTVTAAWTA